MSYKNVEIPNGSRFLVTGGAGFIGSNLCEAILSMGHSVRCLDNFSTGKIDNIEGFRKNENFELVIGDIRDKDTCNEVCRGIDYVLHQAAWGSVPRSIEMPLEYEEINIKGTVNMMEAAKNNGVKRFVYASSAAVYGDDERLPKKEGEEGTLLSPYAVTKKVDEYYGNIYHMMYGLETVGLRYFNVFGKRQDPDGDYASVIPKFVKMLIDGEAPVINGDGSQSRDFVYIDNVVEANLRACVAPSEVAGQAFNVAYGQRKCVIDMYNVMAKLMDKDIEPVFGDERVGDIKHSDADISKAKNMMKYSPKYSFDDGIKMTIDWYRDNIS